MSGQALPKPLNVSSEKPAAVSAYRRRFRTLSTSANEYLPGSTIKIPIDTSMHGSFMDPKTMRLEFSVRIKNNNPFVDFLDLDTCGFNSIFEQMRVVVNGNAIENNIAYATAFQDSLNKLGLNQDEYEMFRSNLFIPGVEEGGPVCGHINLVKPCMVDIFGRPMNHKKVLKDNQAGRYFTSSSISASHDSAFIDGGSERSKLITTDNTNGVLEQPLRGTHVAATGDTLRAKELTLTADGLAGANYAITQSGNDTMITQQGSMWISRAAETLQRDHLVAAGDQYVGYSVDYVTPVSWPFHQPNRQLAESKTKMDSRRWADISSYFSNVKNIPIGVKNVTGATAFTLVNYKTGYTSRQTSYEKAVYEFKVSTHILSGIFGPLASKMLPDMLIGSGKMWIELVLADAKKALQVCMDPCRVVPGTCRGWRPYDGRISNVAISDAITDQNSYPYIGKYQCPRPEGSSAAAAYKHEVWNSSVMFSTRAALGLHGAYHEIIISGSELADNLGTSASDKLAMPILSGAVGVGVPQYVPTTAVWNRIQTTATHASERSVCFGTYLPASQAQSRRTIKDSNPPDFVNDYGSTETMYTVINVELVGEQILLPDAGVYIFFLFFSFLFLPFLLYSYPRSGWCSCNRSIEYAYIHDFCLVQQCSPNHHPELVLTRYRSFCQQFNLSFSVECTNF